MYKREPTGPESGRQTVLTTYFLTEVLKKVPAGNQCSQVQKCWSSFQVSNAYSQFDSFIWNAAQYLMKLPTLDLCKQSLYKAVQSLWESCLSLER